MDYESPLPCLDLVNDDCCHYLTASHPMTTAGSSGSSFPSKLHRMLSDVEENGLEHVVSWASHGRSFKVHDKKTFLTEIMPKYFYQLKYNSFQRQLNLYGFKKIQNQGRDKGSFYHENFLRGMPQLAGTILRTKGKGDTGRPRATETEPNFYAMTSMPASATCKDSSPMVAEAFGLKDRVRDNARAALVLNHETCCTSPRPKSPESLISFEDMMMGEIPMMQVFLGRDAGPAPERQQLAVPLATANSTKPQEDGQHKELTGIGCSDVVASRPMVAPAGALSKASYQPNELPLVDRPHDETQTSLGTYWPFSKDTISVKPSGSRVSRPKEQPQPWKRHASDHVTASMLLVQSPAEQVIKSSKASQTKDLQHSDLEMSQQRPLQASTLVAQAKEPSLSIAWCQALTADYFPKELITMNMDGVRKQVKGQAKQCLGVSHSQLRIARSAAEETDECSCLERMLLRSFENAEMEELAYF